MNQPPLRLYVDSLYTSPYAMSVFVTLREKGLAFDHGHPRTSTPRRTRRPTSPTCP